MSENGPLKISVDMIKAASGAAKDLDSSDPVKSGVAKALHSSVKLPDDTPIEGPIALDYKLLDLPELTAAPHVQVIVDGQVVSSADLTSYDATTESPELPKAQTSFTIFPK